MLDKPKFLAGEVKEFIDLELKNIPVRLYSLGQVKRNKELLLNFNKVRIWSVEHQQYWRPNSQGYTGDRELSGVYEFPDAFERTKHCDESKGITFEEVFNIKDFYNQPFETVMIEKYFEDFNLLSRNGAGEEPHFGFKNGTYHLWFTYYRVIIERNNPSETHKTMLPRTLNHFISDCKRAGIKLEWRE